MLNFLLINADVFYLVFVTMVSITCVMAADQSAFVSAIILWFMYLVAQFPQLWTNPVILFYLHVGIVFIIAGAIHCEFARRKLDIILLMVLADFAWIGMPLLNLPENSYYFPYDVFWLQNVLNLLLLWYGAISFVGSFRLLKNHRVDKHHGNMAARTTVNKKLAGGLSG